MMLSDVLILIRIPLEARSWQWRRKQRCKEIERLAHSDLGTAVGMGLERRVSSYFLLRDSQGQAPNQLSFSQGATTSMNQPWDTADFLVILVSFLLLYIQLYSQLLTQHVLMQMQMYCGVCLGPQRWQDGVWLTPSDLGRFLFALQLSWRRVSAIYTC